MAAAGEEAESSTAAAGGQQRAPFARGGPVFVPFMVGPMSTVPEFMSSALLELQSLEAELGEPSDEFDDELCVDELRVLSEEELVERALQEAMEVSLCYYSEDWDSDAPQLTEGQRRIGLVATWTEGSAVRIVWMSSDPIPVDQALASSPSAERECSGLPIEDMATGSYLTKAVKMAEIKAKQEEDKLAVSGDSVRSKGSKSSPEKTEMAKTLKYISAPWKVWTGSVHLMHLFTQVSWLQNFSFTVYFVPQKKASKSEEHRPVAHPEVILCVEVYEKRYGSVKSQEFLVLGSQFLTDLRDSIYCLTDNLMKRAGQHDHSGYFLIEDTFYNDTRHYSATDYSKPILDWLQNSSEEVSEKWDAITSGVLKKRQKDLLRGLSISNVPEFKSGGCKGFVFLTCSSGLVLGTSTVISRSFPYIPDIYHRLLFQGNCKHMIVIRDMRLIHPDDTQNQADYPLPTFQLQRRLQKCSVCQIYAATKMTVDDKWALNNPCYFCIKCYYLLHYKEDGSLLYHHTVYDYIQE
ncbi:hypothetical protein PR202_ga08544 [Eleusine coracana subsp. coracana]|uniref:snRNA-activating protein complex subunit n=1 Tax=Eleusine coracana subsp. coracana TaxID=191504 RepID=A0AAV5C0H2_ELECO|nr:hypothetical protein PR202_ga08544 [Eleusine coracana subsp. coracana]